MRRYPIGAEIVTGQDGGRAVDFRLWAPACKSVQILLEGGPGSPDRVEMAPEPDGYFSARSESGGAGTCYRFLLNGEDKEFPDPASRFQPEGPHGTSEVIDPLPFQWTDREWRGPHQEGQVVYEMHIGTFTQEGTWSAATAQLAELSRLGISVLEIMPVADFAGDFGWGYDGVDLFAPSRCYGRPDEFRTFIDTAHALNMGVILDVVYNHVGPDGNYLRQFSPAYFTSRYENEWGEAINFDGPNSGPVREFYIANAAYWIDEYHLDGLRLDATQQIFDSSKSHVVQDVVKHARNTAGGKRLLIVGENEPQEAKYVRSSEHGGYGVDALWNDDFHHAGVVALTGRYEAYYSDYRGSPQEFVSAYKYGYLYQGQEYSWQNKRRGTSCLDLEPSQFVVFLENHDQVANSGRGKRLRLLSQPAKFRALTAVLLLSPNIPMLFQGQEFGSTAPFLFFADHDPKLADKVRKGRAGFLSQFRSLSRPEMKKRLSDPADHSVFTRCKLDHGERERNHEMYALHKDLIALRRTDVCFQLAASRKSLDGAVLSPDAFVVRYFGEKHQGHRDERLLLVNLGIDLHLRSAPEPLLAPPDEAQWDMIWSSEDPKYGGVGTYPPETGEEWILPAYSAVVMAARRKGASKDR